MLNNIFSGKRFLLLFRQHFIHNTQLLLLSSVAYVGVIFIVLSFVQIGEGFRPHDVENFQGFLIGFVSVFGIIYAGHSFPALRSKESTISYLMVPASVTEKFLFEFISRIVIVILILPLLYWATFHLQGYFFAIFASETFHPINLQYLVKIEVADKYRFLVYTVTTAGVMLAFVLAFTGAAMFGKQPLVKSLFAVAVIVAFYFGYGYIVLEHLGLGRYVAPEQMYLLPMTDQRAFQFAIFAVITTIIIMLFVAFRKLKEREV